MPKKAAAKTPSLTGLLSPAFEEGILGFLKVKIARARAQEKLQNELAERVLGYLDKQEKRSAKYDEPGSGIAAVPGIGADFAARANFFHPISAPEMPKLTPFEDARGSIANIAENTVGGVQVIVSKAGSTRAKHTHKTDTHVCYVISGRVIYRECPAHGPGTQHDGQPIRAEGIDVRAFTFLPGERFVTGPNIAHQMDFPVDTVMVVMSEHPRDPASYDADIVRFDKSLV